MPLFPRKEIEVQNLAHHMIAGYTDKPAMFPNADVAGLQAVLAEYEAKKSKQEETEAKHHLATKAKNGALLGLERKMRDQFKQSEVDVGADVGELEIIGWGPRAKPAPAAVPGQVRMLRIVEEGVGTVKLVWKAPDRAMGGAVQTYKIERREEPGPGQSYTEWHEVGTAFVTEVSLTGQPRGLQMEYQVLGGNSAGEGKASNVVDVVL